MPESSGTSSLKIAEQTTILPLSPFINESEVILENSVQAGTEPPTIVGFTVLQCRQCRTIVGDTGSMVSFNRESFIMTLQSKTGYQNFG